MTKKTWNDSSLLDLQRQGFQYFHDLANPENGLVPDTNEPGSPASIAGVGFALACYVIGVENKFIPRKDAAARVISTLRFFWNGDQSGTGASIGHRGFYFHFLDMKSGNRVWDCELSFIDTGILLAGIVCAHEYFDGNNLEEVEIRELAKKLVDRVDWHWASEGKPSLSQGWFSESGFIRYDWEGYSEALVLYCLAMGSETKPLPPESFHVWTSTYQWENIYDVDLLYAGPLFIHFFSQAWIDFRAIQDRFMREKKSDYFQNTQRAIQVQRIYCTKNPNNFTGYSRECWGLTADAGPGSQVKRADGKRAVFFDYSARGVPFGPDDGTIAPWAALAALPFEPKAALAMLDHLSTTYPDLWGKYGMKCSINLTASPPWLPDRFYALDLGLSMIMIENARSELIWNLMKKSKIIQQGLLSAGFRGGWLGGKL